ncbi:glycosyltransferase domain-containing protein [Phaeodactylibacter xiamenensis]|uniref:glycosyltransferase domain-containing protein n=1 Tax=Phaeodactylibacter xiamenensis TaxID=1524460 RepID=UPI0024A94759|nr:glycosyltransferase domain-containing protein [Phaeodactylibacter xiamenensis]
MRPLQATPKSSHLNPLSPILALYTAIFSPYDTLRPQPDFPGVDYLCFTDQPLQSDQYQIISCPPLHQDPVRASRLPKLLPHLFLPHYPTSIWHDANMQFTGPAILSLFREALRQSPFVLFRHPYRDCIYEEAGWCTRHHKDDPVIIQKTVDTLRTQNYPPHQGLAACGLIARQHHHAAVIQFSNAWWHFYQQHSRRDQLSFNYIAWQQQLPFRALPINIYDNPYLSIAPHKNRG